MARRKFAREGGGGEVPPIRFTLPDPPPYPELYPEGDWLLSKTLVDGRDQIRAVARV